MAFLLVYIREANPDDGSQAGASAQDAVIITAPKSAGERSIAATSCQAGLHLSLPMVIDGMDNAVEAAYASWPDRLYVVGTDGKIAYQGAPGPAGFHPEEMQATLDRLLAGNDRPHKLRTVPAYFPDRPSTSVQVQLPWNGGGVTNLMLPECLYSGETLVFTGQNWVAVEAEYPQEVQPEWKEIAPARLLRYEHSLGEEYVLRAEVQVREGAIDQQLSIENRTKQPLTDLRAQICFAAQQAQDFSTGDLSRVYVPVGGTMTPITEVPKAGVWDTLKRYLLVAGVPSPDDVARADAPLIALANQPGTHAIGVSWPTARYVFTNAELSCIHADPYLPDCPAGDTVSVRGTITFVEGSAQALLK